MGEPRSSGRHIGGFSGQTAVLNVNDFVEYENLDRIGILFYNWKRN